MLFNTDEYLLLSRSGRVPLSATRPRRPPDPSLPDRTPPPDPGRGRPGARRMLVARIAAARAVRGGLRATWTAFGPGSAEL